MSLPSPIMNASWADEVDKNLHPSVHRDGDEYDNLGRNMSAQIRREKLVKWTRVVYSHKRY